MYGKTHQLMSETNLFLLCTPHGVVNSCYCVALFYREQLKRTKECLPKEIFYKTHIERALFLFCFHSLFKYEFLFYKTINLPGVCDHMTGVFT